MDDLFICTAPEPLDLLDFEAEDELEAAQVADLREALLGLPARPGTIR